MRIGRARQLLSGDVGAVLLAAGAAAGALWARNVPWVLLVAAAVALALSRHPLLLLVCVVLAASTLAARAWSGMVQPEARAFAGVATLVDDPVRVGGAVHVIVRLDGRHYDAWARGASAVVLEPRLAGERVALRGNLSSNRVPPYLRIRHVVGRITVASADAVRGEHIVAAVANRVRRTLERGARTLTADDRALFTGLVVGDDREQSLEVRDDFLGSGLAHLLAVSGQNVAFVLALVEPIGNRIGPRVRVVLLSAVLVLFASITRFEPSVLRATTMAALVMLSTVVGRPVSSIRVLSLTVCGLLLLDPFLVRSLGFGLSVSASAGIVLVGSPVARALPGPAWLARALGVIVGAQLGVAPLLLLAFGGIPVATLPANLLAEPVAGLAMMWGASAGLLAGVVPDGLADLLHRPTGVAMWWIATVARRSADAGLGELGPVSLVAATAAGIVAFAGRGRSPWLSRLCTTALVIVLLAPSIRLRWPGDEHVVLAGAGVLSRSGGAATLVLEPHARPSAALRAVRRAGVGALDRLVLPSDGSSAKAVASLLARRMRIAQTVVDPADRPP